MAREKVSGPKVYVAASSAEIERAKRWRDRLRQAGVDAMASWIDSIEQAGAANPDSWPPVQRRRVALECLSEAATALTVWFLVPPKAYPDLATRGAWAEIGFAYGGARQLVFSGDTRQSVFCALGAEYSTDEEAFARILSSFGLGEPIPS
jgi:hypothetical protein